MRTISYIGETPINNNHAGNKARLDIDKILKNRYITTVRDLVVVEFKSALHKIVYGLNFKNWIEIYLIRSISRKSILIQYPAYYNFLLRKSVYSLLNSNEVILIVHDVDSLRGYGKNIVDDEIKKFNKCKAILVHNDFMREELKKMGCVVPMICLNLFDYLLLNIPENKFVLGKQIVFAGNLIKSEFIKTKYFGDLDVTFNLYGPNYDSKVITHKNVKYKGSYKPDEIPYVLEGSFGLIWDGNTIVTCSGGVGAYMRYNNPHKLSLYIAAGLPVIVWKEAAVAKFVEDNDIGFTVNSLYEISNRIDVLTNDEYNKFLQNIKVLQEKVCSGYFTNKALDEAEKYLE